jgi:hypothetical protein
MGCRSRAFSLAVLVLVATARIVGAQALQPGRAVVLVPADRGLPSYANGMRLLVGGSGDLFAVGVLESRVLERSNGGTLRFIGRQGDGPGEFRMISNGGLLADTLWLVAEVHRRVTLFPAAGRGKPVTVTLTQSAGRTSTALPYLLGEGGVNWSLDIADASRRRAELISDVKVVRTSRDGTYLDGAPTLPAKLEVFSQQHRITLPGPRTIVRQQPFLDRSLLGISSNGRFLAIVNQADPTRATSTGARVFLWSSAGKTKCNLRYP